MLKINRIIFCCLLIAAHLCAKNGSNGGQPGAYLRMGLGARALSMGNTGIACSQNGFAPFYNPAGISRLQNRHFALSYSFLALDRQLHYTGLVIPLKPTAGIGLSWMHGGVDNIEGRSSTGKADGTYKTGEDVFIMSFANSFHPKFSIGLNFKILRNELLDLQATGLGFDIGFLFCPNDYIAIGLQFKDIGAGYTWKTQDLFGDKGGNYTERFPEIAKFGIALSQNNFMICADAEYSSQEDFRAHFGGEYRFMDLGHLRLGINDRYPTLGGGLTYNFIGKTDTNLDYCVVFDMVGEGETHVFSWEFKF